MGQISDVCLFQPVSEHEQRAHAPAPSPSPSPGLAHHEMSAPGAEVTRSAEPGDAAGARPGQERHQDCGEDQQQAGASGQALKCPT